jgi:hypothetical protein
MSPGSAFLIASCPLLSALCKHPSARHDRYEPHAAQGRLNLSPQEIFINAKMQSQRLGRKASFMVQQAEVLAGLPIKPEPVDAEGGHQPAHISEVQLPIFRVQDAAAKDPQEMDQTTRKAVSKFGDLVPCLWGDQDIQVGGHHLANGPHFGRRVIVEREPKVCVRLTTSSI